MSDPYRTETVRRKYLSLDPLLDERLRWLWAAAEASKIGWGGVTAVSLATGLSQATIAAGLQDLRTGVMRGESEGIRGRVRRPGGAVNR